MDGVKVISRSGMLGVGVGIKGGVNEASLSGIIGSGVNEASLPGILGSGVGITVLCPSKLEADGVLISFDGTL
jgi:hypothetical protein